MITITTSNGISVRQDGIRSALGRIGFNLSKDIDEKTNIYLKANLLHEFGGGCHAAMADSGGSRIKIDRSLKIHGLSMALGAAIQTGTNNHVYLDFERSAGGDFKKIGAGILVHAGLSNNLLK
ncbi:MAG: autotransporter outer membrane beta-barrel domain-containing protein [Phascolarctobacterium faecium]